MISGIPPSLIVDVLSACLIPMLAGMCMRTLADAVAVGMTTGIFARIAAFMADITPRFLDAPVLSEAGAVTILGIMLTMIVWAALGHGMRRGALAVWRRVRRPLPHLDGAKTGGPG